MKIGADNFAPVLFIIISIVLCYTALVAMASYAIGKYGAFWFEDNAEVDGTFMAARGAAGISTGVLALAWLVMLVISITVLVERRREYKKCLRKLVRDHVEE